ncbi:MAG: DNA polymerase III subunit gamma/tau [Candidatus Jorgensenbacteria bacterium]|nr:DNA polymerase III subunit gamma/tau [Candidatus Jorgensenbacteria bacterium]
MALAIYRKYRPATFDELLGQELTVRILKESARTTRLAHAYLFSGPRGTGKTTTARLIAKIANCETRASDANFRAKGEPCNRCTACREIDEGRHLDVIEIDAASNRGIDEMRDLKEHVRAAPSKGQSKVFIIDEAHQLTKDAWNALLKTLEEPPPQVILILATTEVEKVPPTITSRTQMFHFRSVTRDEIAGKLATVAKAEGVNVGEEALDLIAAAAEGSFRDAESLFDQLITFKGKVFTVEDVEAMIGKVAFVKLAAFVELLLKRDLDKALARVEEIQDGGYSLVQFTKDIIQYLRRVAVLSYQPAMEQKFAEELTLDHMKTLVGHAKLFQPGHLELLKTFIRAYSQMRYSQFPLIPLEVAVIEGLRDEKN